MSDGQGDIAETALDHVATPSRPVECADATVPRPVATDNPIKHNVLDPSEGSPCNLPRHLVTPDTPLVR